MWLFPRLGAMALDTMERYKYFGLRSIRSCGVCRRRPGRSASRSATRHNGKHIKNLYVTANADARTMEAIRTRKRARDKLLRHGFQPKKRCRLLRYAKHCVVPISKFGSEVYCGLIRYEKMHVYFIAYCSYLLDHLAKLVHKRHVSFVHKIVCACHQFRDPVTGVSHPRLPTVLHMVHMTAERRVRAIFYWAHVLGTRAEVIVPQCRKYAQGAVATLQLILIATRQHRSYTRKELNSIFTDAGNQFFRCLEQIAAYLESERLARVRIAHEQNPTRVKAPVPFKRMNRLHICPMQNIYVHFIAYIYAHICPMQNIYVHFIAYIIRSYMFMSAHMCSHYNIYYTFLSCQNIYAH